MRTILHEQYQVSARVLLQVGDVFRANGGPYYVLQDETGKKIKSSMAAKGPFKFCAYCERGRKKWIEAHSIKEGGFVILPLTRWRTIDLSNFVNRPYKILGKKREKKR
jgi:hypothetical protein